MAEKTKISERLDENIAHMEELFHTCDDIKKKRMNLGKNRDVACYLTFIEVSVDMGNSALLEVLKYLRGLRTECPRNLRCDLFYDDRGGGGRSFDRRSRFFRRRFCESGQDSG